MPALLMLISTVMSMMIDIMTPIVETGAVGAGGGPTGHTVVYTGMVSVVFWPIGQSVTCGGHDVIVYVIVVYAVEVVNPLEAGGVRGTVGKSPLSDPVAIIELVGALLEYPGHPACNS